MVTSGLLNSNFTIRTTLAISSYYHAPAIGAASFVLFALRLCLERRGEDGSGSYTIFAGVLNSSSVWIYFQP